MGFLQSISGGILHIWDTFIISIKVNYKKQKIFWWFRRLYERVLFSENVVYETSRTNCYVTYVNTSKIAIELRTAS